MLNAVYRLVAPRRFEVEFGEVPLFGQEVIVRPTHLSICHADHITACMCDPIKSLQCMNADGY